MALLLTVPDPTTPGKSSEKRAVGNQASQLVLGVPDASALAVYLDATPPLGAGFQLASGLVVHTGTVIAIPANATKLTIWMIYTPGASQTNAGANVSVYAGIAGSGNQDYVENQPADTLGDGAPGHSVAALVRVVDLPPGMTHVRIDTNDLDTTHPGKLYLRISFR